MRILIATDIEQAVAELCVDACCALPADVLQALRAAYETETGPAKVSLGHILENEALARASRRPCCQDTGIVLAFVDIGQDVFIEGDLNAAIHAGVARAYTGAYLRKSMLSALARENTGDNTPAMIHLRFVPGDKVTLHIALKGIGSENMSKLFMLKPSDGEEGILNSIVHTADAGAANACPPVILGVGIGGSMEMAAIESKRQLLRELGSAPATAALARLESEALRRVNALGIGPMGLSGACTALAVHMGEIPTHIGGLPVAITVQCHCARHLSVVL